MSTDSSIEDVLSRAVWVNHLIDPQLHVDKLHDTFMEVIFQFPLEDNDKKEPSGRRVKTAAEKRREAEHKRRLREELQELEGGTPGSGDRLSDDEDDSVMSDEEEFENGEIQEADKDFLDWIHFGHPSSTREEQEERDERRDIELDLRAAGLGIEKEKGATNDLPDRYIDVDQQEGRYRLGTKDLPGGYSYDLPVESEAYWILRQLRNAGQPLAHNTRICALASRPLASIVDEPVMVALCYAVEKMTRDYLEPAHLMMYHQTPLHPLLFALFEDSALRVAARQTAPLTSYAYSITTGCRQEPVMTENDISFDTLATRSVVRTRDPLWRQMDKGDNFSQRKPCFIELGRLLVRILELDALCHRLECRRWQMLLQLEASTEAKVLEQHSILQETVFESAADVDIWHTFVQSLVATRQGSRSAFRVVQELGLEAVFEEYSLTALQYQDNLLKGTPIALCPTQRIRLRQWADNVGQRVHRRPISAEEVVSLFNCTIVDQFSKLPFLCKQVMDRFCTLGHLIVTHSQVKQSDDIYPISTFFVQHPGFYLDLLIRQSQKEIELHYVLDEEHVRQILRQNELYHVRDTSSNFQYDDIQGEWFTERESAFDSLVPALIDAVIPRVKTELRDHARYQTAKKSVDRLGALCSQGPYQLTKLALTAFSEEVLLWEPEWNVVEALPVHEPVGPRILERVCSVFRDSNGVMIFAFVDEMGALMGKYRWAESNMNTTHGKRKDLMNQLGLFKLFGAHHPAVVAVAASDNEALRVMQRVQTFLKERVYSGLNVRIPVVWASAEIPRFFSQSRFADLEMGCEDAGFRISVGLARYVQDPLFVISTLFDSKRTALQLFSSGFTFSSREQNELYSALCWEMSLWVSSTGFWIEDCIRRPSSLALLQFVPGLGAYKASGVHKAINVHCPADRRALKQLLMDQTSPVVTANALPCLRVASPLRHDIRDLGVMDEGAGSWHPLDQTLIPLEWYDVALHMSAVATRNDRLNVPCYLQFNLVDFLSKPMNTRRDAVDEEISNSRILRTILEEKLDGSNLIDGTKELDLIADELIANGSSFMRRPYRRMTTKAFVLSMTGIAYLSSEEAPTTVRTKLNDQVIEENSYVDGTIDGFRGGRQSGIRVTTSRGLRAFIPLSEIEEEATRQEVEQHIRCLDAAREEQDPTALDYVGPEWLQRGTVVQGIVRRCNWSRCELLLRLCPPRSTAGALSTSQENGTNYVSYADVLRDVASSANSLRTELLVENAYIFSKKISEHPMFRDISHTEAVTALRDKDIGEFLFRPSSDKRKVVCMLKLGDLVTCNMKLSEERRADGSIYYSFSDTIINSPKEFNDADEFHLKLLRPMAVLVRQLREHRRFVADLRDVETSLAEQQQGSERLAYVFAENTKTLLPPLYRVFTKGGNRRHSFHLHISDKCLHVRLPVLDKASNSLKYVWFDCDNAEQLSKTVKMHASSSC